MLNGVLPLGDIRDVERFCDHIAEQACGQLSHHEREDLVTYLIEQTWIMSRRYDQHHPAGAKFSSYVHKQLRLRVVDWQRRKYGRLRPGRDAKDNPGEWGVLSVEGLADGEFERSLGARVGDDPFDRVSARIGLLDAGGGAARRASAGRGAAASRRVA